MSRLYFYKRYQDNNTHESKSLISIYFSVGPKYFVLLRVPRLYKFVRYV